MANVFGAVEPSQLCRVPLGNGIGLEISEFFVSEICRESCAAYKRDRRRSKDQSFVSGIIDGESDFRPIWSPSSTPRTQAE